MPRRGSTARGDTQKAGTAEIQAFALALRHDGHSYRMIGILCGQQFRGSAFTEMYAGKLVKNAIKSVYRDKAEDVVKLEMDRLDQLQLEAIAVLRTKHVMISNGAIVRVNLRDEHGILVMDQATGLPKTEPIEDDGPKLAAIDRLLKIQERRSKLLGLDKPTKIAPTDPDGKKLKTAVIMVSELDAKI